MRNLLVTAAALALLGGAATAATGPAAFQISRVALPGDGRGDYLTVDGEGHRLYVTHGPQVHILNLDTLMPIGTVTGLKVAHGVALAGGHGFVTDGDSNAVVEFDPATGATIKTIPAGRKPDSILFDSASGKILAFGGASSDVSVIDPATATVVATIALPQAPEFPQTDGKGKVWVNLEEGNAIGVIDTKTMTLARTIPLPGCDGPAPLAFDAANRVLFAGCGNKVMSVVDADSGKTLAMVPVGGGPDGVAFDPTRKRIYVANRDGGWTIVDQRAKDRYVVDQTLKVDEYAKTVAVDPKTHRAFSSTVDLVWAPAVAGKRRTPTATPGSFRVVVVSEK